MATQNGSNVYLTIAISQSQLKTFFWHIAIIPFFWWIVRRSAPNLISERRGNNIFKFSPYIQSYLTLTKVHNTLGIVFLAAFHLGDHIQQWHRIGQIILKHALLSGSTALERHKTLWVNMLCRVSYWFVCLSPWVGKYRRTIHLIGKGLGPCGSSKTTQRWGSENTINHFNQKNWWNLWHHRLMSAFCHSCLGVWSPQNYTIICLLQTSYLSQRQTDGCRDFKKVRLIQSR